jgi:hypothetical protein
MTPPATGSPADSRRGRVREKRMHAIGIATTPIIMLNEQD